MAMKQTHAALFTDHEVTAVAVSGGQDSLLALARLTTERGAARVFAIHGLFLPEPAAAAPTAGLEAMCRRLDVPLVTVDLRAPFHKAVIEPFIEAYFAGETPNPCALCNRAVKFGLLFEAARRHGAQRLATGHYARLSAEADGPALRRGLDAAKDQSYFLALTPQPILRDVVFPLGETRKTEVGAALAALGLEPPLPKESQEVCFVPGDDYVAYLERIARSTGRALPPAGAIVLGERVMGRHRGLHRYTQGQRRGLGVSHTEPLYVIEKDMAANTLRVGPKTATRVETCVMRGVNPLAGPPWWPPAANATVFVKTRYRQALAPARLHRREEAPDSYDIHFQTPHGLPAPGQVAAVYATDTPEARLLAGGLLV